MVVNIIFDKPLLEKTKHGKKIKLLQNQRAFKKYLKQLKI
jgi:hypothetical protein